MSGPLRLGDVELYRAAATPAAGAEWRLLERVCRGSGAPALGQPIVALDGACDETRLPAAVAERVRALGAMTPLEAQEHLLACGYECPSLYWGAWSEAIEGEARVLWRCDAGAVGDRPGRVALPIYPALRHHAARGEPVLHAAAVAGGARAVLLLGPSGAGKSTAARNAGDAGGQVLCDDGVLVAREGDGFLAVPLPSVAAVGPDSAPPPARRLPIAAVFFLEHAPADRIIAVTAAEAVRRLAQSCFIEVPAACWLPSPLQGELFHRLCDLARAVPAFRLALRPTPAYFDLVRRELALDG